MNVIVLRLFTKNMGKICYTINTNILHVLVIAVTFAVFLESNMSSLLH